VVRRIPLASFSSVGLARREDEIAPLPRLRVTHAAEDDSLITVAIPARDEEAYVGQCLDSILAQDEPNLQVIVVDGTSKDGTAAVVRSYMERDPRVELLHNPKGSVPTSLNMALSAARGRWFVRVDAHATIPPGYVRRAVTHLRTGSWGGVGGRKDGVGVTSAGRAVAAAMGSRFGVGNSTYHYGTSVQTVEHIPFGCYPTGLARELGGWRDRLRVNQDFEFDYRVRESGHDLLFDPELVIRWHCRQSLPDLYRQYRRYGRGKVVVARMHPRSIRLRHLAAPALVAAGAVAVAVATRRPKLAAAMLAPYAAALAAGSAATARKVDGPAAKAAVPGAFIAMHAGWGVGFWQGVVDVIREAASHPETH
jgi:cellulose synthase/poly-beta-1,6-N-acetylglucosamine synthase-like glycosyltransferase